MITMDMLDGWWAAYASIMLLSLYFATQALYSLSLLVDGYLFSRPVNMIDMGERFQLVPGSNKDYPPIVLFYPVLDEQESVMRTTMIALDELEYPKDRYRVIAIPNSSDLATIASLKTLQTEFPFLELARGAPDGSSVVAGGLGCLEQQSQGLLVASRRERLQQGPAAQEDPPARLRLLQLDDDQSGRRHA